jgi:integrase
MGLGKQAKIFTKQTEKMVLSYIEGNSVQAKRDKCIVKLSVLAGLRSKEIAELRFSFITSSDGQIDQFIRLPDSAAKGKSGRVVPIHPRLHASLVELQNIEFDKKGEVRPDAPVIRSIRGGAMSANSITVWFSLLYKKLNLDGCSSHSGRRTFITRTARAISKHGGSLRDIQLLAGHSSIAVTQLYIAGSENAQVDVVRSL